MATRAKFEDRFSPSTGGSVIPAVTNDSIDNLIEGTRNKLQHKLLIIRQKGQEQWGTLIQSVLAGDSSLDKEAFEQLLEDVFSWTTDDSKWELRQSGFLGIREVLKAGYELKATKHTELIEIARIRLEDTESRVRMAVAEMLEELVRVVGISVYTCLRDDIIDSIEENFVRDELDQKADAEKESVTGNAGNTNHNQEDSAKQPHDQDHGDGQGHNNSHSHSHSHSGQRPTPNDDGDFPDGTSLKAPKGKHDTEGWKSLETSFTALQRMMMGAGASFSPHITQELLALIFRSVKHTNRFVRETGYFVCATISQICSSSHLSEIANSLTSVLAFGLADNWSQVRFAASTATRSFMEAADQTIRQDYYSRLLPPMCLNRYYVAEGVRLYSQETWKTVIGAQGVQLVETYIDDIVKFYIQQAEADNHAVREAACHCTAELGTKVNKVVVAPHVPKLLAMLIMCFKDESWPVRDAACGASGLFVSSFPQESRGSLDELYELWFAHLADNIPSVREGTAVALGRVLEAYQQEALDKVMAHIEHDLEAVKEQKADSKQYSELTNTTTFGVAAKRIRDNDANLHTNQQVFSCGSLAPKLRRAAGCMDHSFRRASEPWERSDGCIYMIREMAVSFPDSVPTYIPIIAQMASLTHYAHYPNFLRTVWSSIPLIAKRMGKKPFKRVMQELMDPLFKTLSCGNNLTMHCAAQCIVALSKFVGPSIFKGRLDDDHVRVLETNPLILQHSRSSSNVSSDASSTSSESAVHLAARKAQYDSMDQIVFPPPSK